jgi:hypothetical protein
VLGGEADCRQPKDQERNGSRSSHRARLYHSRVNHPTNQIRLSKVRPAEERIGIA